MLELLECWSIELLGMFELRTGFEGWDLRYCWLRECCSWSGCLSLGIGCHKINGSFCSAIAECIGNQHPNNRCEEEIGVVADSVDGTRVRVHLRRSTLVLQKKTTEEEAHRKNRDVRYPERRATDELEMEVDQIPARSFWT